MTISQTSWHWRVFLRWEDRQRRYMDWVRMSDSAKPRYERKTLTLCRYFWTVVLAAPVYWLADHRVTQILLMLVVAASALATVGALGYIVYMLFTDYGWLGFLYILGFVLVVVAALGVLALIAGGVAWVVINKRAGTKLRDSLVVQYVKAKKRRVCPLIAVDDEAPLPRPVT